MVENYLAAIQAMERKLPKRITTLEQIVKLPWGGNAAWDVPIMERVDQALICNAKQPLELRKQGLMLAGYLMTGEASLVTDEALETYVKIATEAEGQANANHG